MAVYKNFKKMGKIRLKLGKALIHSSNAFYKATRALTSCLLSPDDLIALSKACYSLPGYLSNCSEDAYLNYGLTQSEDAFIKKYAMPGNNILVMGCGGGRECIALAKNGFQVTGVDFSPSCINVAKENARRLGYKINYICQEATSIDLHNCIKYDAALFSGLLYSLIPSGKKRLEALERIKNSLKKYAMLYLNFFSTTKNQPKYEVACKLIARLTLGNTSWESGDYVENDGEYKHYFTHKSINLELSKSNYELKELNTQDPTDSFATLCLVSPTR